MALLKMDENEDFGALEMLDRNFEETVRNVESQLTMLHSSEEKCLARAWIRRLRNQDNYTAQEKKVRNQYCSALMEMVRHGDLEEPFTLHPDDVSTLPPLSAHYLPSSSFQEPRLPDWLERINHEIEDVDDAGGRGERRSFLSSPFPTFTRDRRSSLESGRRRRRHRSRNTDDETDEENKGDRGDAYSARSIELCRGAGPIGDGDFPHSYRSGASHYNDRWNGSVGRRMNNSFTADTTLAHMQEKELERKAEAMQSQFHEEVLKLQDRHKRDVQKLIDRKNEEIEEVRTEYKAKLKEQEDLCAKFEQKIVSMRGEIRQLKETKEKERDDLKKTFRESLEAKEKEMSHKIEALVREFEREREALQTSNKRRFQTLLEDTNNRLRDMEAHYKSKVQSCESTIQELENRVVEVADEAERIKQARDSLEKTNADASKRIKEMTEEYNALQQQYMELEHQYEQNLQDNTAELRSLREKHNSQLNFTRQERERAEARHEEGRKDLETQVEEARRALRVSEDAHSRDLTERQVEWESERNRLENALSSRLNQTSSEYDAEIVRLKALIRSAEEETGQKEAEARRLREEMAREKQTMEEAMHDLRQQMETSSHHHLEEMRRQIEHVQADLSKSKALRERQAREQARQLEIEREKHAADLKTIREEWVAEKEALIRQHDYEREKIQTQYGSDITQIRETLQAQLNEVQSRWSEQNETDSRKIITLEQTVRCLKEEAANEAQLRKQQLLELGLLREEEKNRLLEEHNKALEAVRQENEKKQLSSEKKHADEMEMLLRKTNEKLKEIEGEYNIRAQQAAKTISDLQSCVQQLTNERSKLQTEADRLLSEKQKENQLEKDKLYEEHRNALEALQKAVSASNGKVVELQRRLTNREEEHEMKLARLRSEHELQTRELMPAGVQRELEETIQSLKTQISFLNRRIRIFQEDDTDEEFHNGEMAGHRLAVPAVVSA